MAMSIWSEWGAGMFVAMAPKRSPMVSTWMSPKMSPTSQHPKVTATMAIRVAGRRREILGTAMMIISVAAETSTVAQSIEAAFLK